MHQTERGILPATVRIVADAGSNVNMVFHLNFPDSAAYQWFSLVCVYGEYDKPCAPGKAEFSLSHGGNWAILASNHVPVGTDIEPLDTANPNAAKRIFTAGRLSWMLHDSRAIACAAIIQWIAWNLKRSSIGLKQISLSYRMNQTNYYSRLYILRYSRLGTPGAS